MGDVCILQPLPCAHTGGKGEDTSVGVSQGLRQAPLLLHARYLLQEVLDLCGFNLTEPEAAAVEERY